MIRSCRLIQYGRKSNKNKIRFSGKSFIKTTYYPKKEEIIYLISQKLFITKCKNGIPERFRKAKKVRL
jgi:hypothetical protein